MNIIVDWRVPAPPGVFLPVPCPVFVVPARLPRCLFNGTGNLCLSRVCPGSPGVFEPVPVHECDQSKNAKFATAPPSFPQPAARTAVQQRATQRSCRAPGQKS